MTRQISTLEEKHSRDLAELVRWCADFEEKYSQSQTELGQVSAALDDANALSSSLRTQLDSEKVTYETVPAFFAPGYLHTKERATDALGKMAGLFFRQFAALFWKNWIVMSKHPWVRLSKTSLRGGEFNLCTLRFQTTVAQHPEMLCHARGVWHLLGCCSALPEQTQQCE